MNELKPCPFCGGTATIMKVEIPEMRVFWRVECSDCGASTWYRMMKREYAVRAWNRRTENADR